MNALIVAASKNGPMAIVANFVLVFLAIFAVISVLACGLYLAGFFTDELGWRMAGAALAWIIFVVSSYTIMMLRDYSRFLRLLRDHQQLLPVRAEVVRSWGADQTGFEVLRFSEGVISFERGYRFETRSEWAFKRIMRRCREMNRSFVAAKIPEPMYR